MQKKLRIFCVLLTTHKLVAMPTSLEKSEKLDLIEKIHANAFHLVKKIVKIGPVDTEIALLIVKK